MDKKELIGFILNDIKELELIVKGMHEIDKIPTVMQELAANKTKSILDRLCRLEENSLKESASNSLTVKELFIPAEKPELQTEEIFIEEIKESLPEEKILETFETEKEDIKEILEEEKIEIPQEVEPEKEKTVSKPEDIREEKQEEEEFPTILEQPEEKKGMVVAQEKSKVQERITNEKFKSQNPSVNSAATTNKRIESRFIQNLRKAINLNDRYRYQRELFGGNVELMNSVIDKLDAMNSLEEAIGYVQKEFVWDKESETVVDFYSLLESRFS